MNDADVVVVGAGVVGLSTALHLARDADRAVVVLEKEPVLAQHQSGRNSGVLHPGFNYEPGSRKARLAAAGTRRAKAFAAEHDVRCREFGVLVAAGDATDRARLEGLIERAAANGVPAELLEGREAIRAREPHVDAETALWCPAAASLDSVAYVGALAQAAIAAGVELRLGARADVIEVADGVVRVTVEGGDVVRARHLVNAAGLHADRIAHAMGVDAGCRIVPFRGEYYGLRRGSRALVRGLIYPVPDPAVPFLGVHFTRRVDDRVLIGPNAVLAFGREGYRLASVDPGDLMEMLAYPGFWRLLASRRMLRLAATELAKSASRGRFLAAARRLVPTLQAADIVPARAGIRAQAVARDGTLVGDPLVESGRASTHVLNAVSPGLTTSLPFGEHVAGRVDARLAGAGDPDADSRLTPS